jgi:hypothetical protein
MRNATNFTNFFFFDDNVTQAPCYLEQEATWKATGKWATHLKRAGFFSKGFTRARLFEDIMSLVSNSTELRVSGLKLLELELDTLQKGRGIILAPLQHSSEGVDIAITGLG